MDILKEEKRNFSSFLRNNRSPGRRPRSPKRRGKGGSQQDQLAISFIRINPGYPSIEHMYIQYICELNTPETTSIIPKEITFRKLSCDLYQLMFSMKLCPAIYSSEKE